MVAGDVTDFHTVFNEGGCDKRRHLIGGGVYNLVDNGLRPRRVSFGALPALLDAFDTVGGEVGFMWDDAVCAVLFTADQ